MTMRVNLCLRPALKLAGGPNWAIPPSGWGRSTAMHATMPRTTGAAGTTAGNVLSAAAPVVPGLPYVGSVSIRAVAAAAGTVSLQWLDAEDLPLPLSPTTAYSQALSTTARLTTGPHVAPLDATQVRVRVTVPAASVQLTAALIEQTNTAGGAYFDGDDVGARWTDDNGFSISVTTGVSDLASSISYDERIGRVRALATGMAPGVGRVRVLRRPTTATRFEQVRGTPVPARAGSVLRSADDYEYPADQNLIYRFESLPGSTEVADTGGVVLAGANPSPVLETLDVFYVPPLARAWIKFIAHPILNRRITITGWSEIERPSRNSVYEVRDRTDPVIVTAGHGSRRTTLTLRTWSVEETQALDESLRQGIPLFLHMPAGYPLPSMYAVPDRYGWRRPSARSRGAIWTVPLTEVAAPAPSIVGQGSTWQTVLDGHATWADLLNSAPTWLAVQ